MITKGGLLFPSRYISVWLRVSVLFVLFFGVVARLLASYSEDGAWGWGWFQMFCVINVFAFLFDTRFFIAGFSAFCDGDVGVQFVRFMMFALSLFLYFVAFFMG